ncbi:MAG TPA: hypothetical protein VHO50_07455 [Bacteroidales bacterium]|nr:hypothetical protein [Bacteroidales bacterium]
MDQVKSSSKRAYIKPELSRIIIDNSISLVMMSAPIDPPPPPMAKSPDKSQTFPSPFEGGTFSE